MTTLSWMFEVRCPSCGHQHEKRGREGAERPTEITPPRPPDVEALIAQEDAAQRRVEVSDQLRNPHPLVQHTGQPLRAAKPDESGIIRAPLVGALPRQRCRERQCPAQPSDHERFGESR